MRHFAKRIVLRALPDTLRERLTRMAVIDAGHGYDVFGANPHWVENALAATNWLYEHYFRVLSFDADRLPTSGPAILASNHSGSLPFDGVMLYSDVVRQTDPPRLPRPIADRFVPVLPFVSTFFARVGVVSGTRGNVRALLERGELLMIFPEGTPGIGKAFAQRYQLQNWRVGHAELAIRHQVPIVPVGIVGAEEQMPQIARLPIKLFGAPYFPITATLVPLPVRYRIYYGEPIDVAGQWDSEAADSPDEVSRLAAQVKAAVQSLLARGLRERTGVFS